MITKDEEGCVFDGWNDMKGFAHRSSLSGFILSVNIAQSPCANKKTRYIARS